MSVAEKHKQQLLSLEQPTTSKEEKVRILQDFQDSFKKAQYTSPEVVIDIFRDRKLLAILAISVWSSELPRWINGLMDGISDCSGVPGLFPDAQIQTLSNAFKKYILGGSWTAMRAYSLLVCFKETQRLLLQDSELYEVLKKEIERPIVWQFLYNISTNELWQQKVLEDKQFVLALLALPEHGDIWDIFFNLAHHPDAKTLLPRDVVVKRAGNSSYVRCTDLCALLCSEDDLKTLKLDDLWIVHTAKLLRVLLTEGFVIANDTSYELLDLILPIANLSVIDSKKEVLGKHLVPLFLKVIADELPPFPRIQGQLKRGRLEAARALWNFAYQEANRNLITAEDGFAKLNSTLTKTDDSILKRSIHGILYMLTAPFSEPQTSGPSGVAQGHIMLSYNWGSQATVKRIAKSLKALGHHIWFDLEQMEGDTLEAMASAIEKADLVLICMTQKYKDSANCRLEGQYCINRKIEFLPLLLQQGYRPDGWLGIALGSRLYYDFSDEKDWDAKMAALAKAIGDRGKGTTTRVCPPQNVEVAPSVHNKHKAVVEWNLDDIRAWMKAEQIEHHFATFKKHKFDGKALIELKSLLVPQKPSFFSYVGEQLKITELGEMLRLVAAIRKL